MVPSIAGPKRPQDRVSLTDAKTAFRSALCRTTSADDGVDEEAEESFPASDPPASNSRANAGRAHKPTPVTLPDGTTFELDHGAVVIASITSCTNTSNPQVMIGAALLAKKAVERGLTAKPWVKTTPRAGVQSGHGLLREGRPDAVPGQARLQPGRLRLHHLHRQLRPADRGGLGRGQPADLAVVSVLSGNRNFEGRINPDVKMNYLASPPLVVAYAIAGTMDIDLATEPLGTDPDGEPVYLRDIWPSPQEVQEVIDAAISSEMFAKDYADVFAGDERWQSLPTPTGDTFTWDGDSTYVRKPPYFEGMAAAPDRRSTDIAGARVLAKLGDSVTTDHISPAGSIKADSPAGALPHRARRGRARTSTRTARAAATTR